MIMKKLTVSVLALVFTLLIPLTALADVNSVEYKDEKTDCVFIIPSGWKLIDGKEIGRSCDYCFINVASEAENEKESGEDKDEDEKKENVTAYISYASFDYYSSLGENEKKGKGRENFDLDSFSIDNAADYLNISADKIKSATYNRLDYYRFTARAEGIASSLDKKQRVTGYLTLVDGWLYEFIFYDGTTSPIYDDFKSLMGSVEIKNTVPEKPKAEVLVTPKRIASLCIMLAALGVFIIVLIKNKK